MPTDPVAGMLDREGATEGAADLIELCCPLMREVVNQATHVHRRCEASSTDEADVHLPPFTLFRHIMEVTDGIEVLLGSACVTPAIPLLRSSSEASLELGYMLEESFEQRALSWIYCNVQGRIWGHRRYDPDTDVGEEFFSVREEEFGEPPTIYADRLGDPDGLREFLGTERFADVASAYDEAPRRRPDWYQLFGGPNDRRQLAEAIGRRTEYDVFYRHWSGYAHARSYSHYLAGHDEETNIPLAHSLRYAGELRDVAMHAINFMLKAFQYMLGHYRPEETLGPWYEREIQGPFDRLRNVEIVVEEGEVVMPW